MNRVLREFHAKPVYFCRAVRAQMEEFFLKSIVTCIIAFVTSAVVSVTGCGQDAAQKSDPPRAETTQAASSANTADTKPQSPQTKTTDAKPPSPQTKTLAKTASYDIPQGDTSFKTYTYYTSLSKNSAQWALQERAYTDENGLRKLGGDYMVALGSYYADALGERFLITLDGGEAFTVVVCDFKSDRDTDAANQYTPVNARMKNVVEFYVDRSLDGTAKRMGNVSFIEGFAGNVVGIEKI